MTKMAERFAEAVNAAERTGNAEPVVALFDDDAECQSLVHLRPLRGIDGVRGFWQEYLGSFRELRSEFERTSDDGRLAVLEWATHGTLASGEPITYRGVSLVEYGEGGVRSFRTYYDPRPLAGRHAAPMHDVAEPEAGVHPHY